MDLCIRKSLVATCSLDKSVRVWNYVDNILEIKKEFPEEAYALAFHPSGFHLVVGFTDKVRMLNILIDDIQAYKEIPVKNCREIAFSHGG